MQTHSEAMLCASCFAPLSVKDQHSNIIRCEYCGAEHVLDRNVRVVMAEDSHAFAVRLAYAISDSFSSWNDMQELISLYSAEPGVVYHRLSFDNISGNTVRNKALELAMWAKRRGLLQELVDVAISLRPYIDLT